MDISVFSVLVPTSELISIVEKLAEKRNSINHLKQKFAQVIGELESEGSALIAHAVTGRIKVAEQSE